jgi:hypothetical protein
MVLNRDCRVEQPSIFNQSKVALVPSDDPLIHRLQDKLKSLGYDTITFQSDD